MASYRSYFGQSSYRNGNMGQGRGWQAKLWILFFQAGVKWVFFFFFKEQELGSIVFVEHRFKENNGQHIEEWLL